MCCPFAIFWRVGTFIILALNRPLSSTALGKSLWSAAHIGNKILETLYPSLADGDSTRPIILVIFGSWIKASLLHLCPDMPKARIALSVFGAPETNRYGTHTSAANRITRTDVVDSLEADGSAIAFEGPCNATALSLLGGVKRHQTPEAHPGYIHRLVPTWHDTIICHMTGTSKMQDFAPCMPLAEVPA